MKTLKQKISWGVLSGIVFTIAGPTHAEDLIPEELDIVSIETELAEPQISSDIIAPVISEETTAPTITTDTELPTVSDTIMSDTPTDATTPVIPTELVLTPEPETPVTQDDETNHNQSEETNNQVTVPAQPEIPETLPTKQITYTWADFVDGKQCATTDVFATNDQEISQLILSYCNYAQKSVWQRWLNAFREVKREYTIQQISKEKNNFIKYLKMIPHLLFDIHNTAATGNTINDQLNQIETAILNKVPQKALTLMTSISDDALKLTLHPVLNEGKNLLNVQKGLTQATMEETND